MNDKRWSSVFTFIEVLVVLVIVTMIGLVGYTVYNRQSGNDGSGQSSSSSSETEANDVSVAPEIKNASDLDKAQEVLDQNDPNASGSDASQLEGELSNF